MLGVDVLARCRRKLGEEDVYTLNVASSLAFTHYVQTKYAKSEAIGRKTLTKQKCIFAFNNKDTLGVHNLYLQPTMRRPRQPRRACPNQ